MKLRFLSALEPPTSFYRDLLPALADAGADVELVITDAEYRGGRGPIGQALAHPRIDVRVMRMGGTAGKGSRRILVYLRYMLAACTHTLFGPRADFNFFLTQPPFFYLWGIALKVLRRQKYGVLIMDMYPDAAVEAGMLSRSSPTTRLAYWISRVGVRQADRVFVIGRCTAEMLERDGVRRNRIVLVPNWANEDEVRPVDPGDNPMRRELGLDDKFIVLYSGNMGVAHFFEDVIEAARRLKDDDRIRFVFIGDGSRLAEIERAKADQQLDNIILLPFQPASNLSNSLSLGDVHLVTLRPGFESVVVPSKAYGILAAGRPLIYQGAASGEIARMVGESAVGTVLAPGDVAGLEHAIRQYSSKPDTAAAQGARAVAVFRARYGRAHALARYRTSLLGGTPSAHAAGIP
jgi:colanic acid biosynthesis glycosyl transferase WcaI